MMPSLVLLRDAIDRPLKRQVLRVTARRLHVVIPTGSAPDPRRAVPVPFDAAFVWDEAVHDRLVAAGATAEAWEAELPNLRQASKSDFQLE